MGRLAGAVQAWPGTPMPEILTKTLGHAATSVEAREHLKNAITAVKEGREVSGQPRLADQ